MPRAIVTGVLLAHGGPFFSIIALPVLVAQRGHGVGSRCGMCSRRVWPAPSCSPWSAYQPHYDPPGNRLLKLHLAGVSEIDAGTTTDALRDAYAGISLSEYVRGLWDNLKEQWLVFGKSNRSHPVDWTQWHQLFHHVPALDVLALGFLGESCAGAWPCDQRRRVGLASRSSRGTRSPRWRSGWSCCLRPAAR